jgi:hypothetical protein
MLIFASLLIAKWARSSLSYRPSKSLAICCTSGAPAEILMVARRICGQQGQLQADPELMLLSCFLFLPISARSFKAHPLGPRAGQLALPPRRPSDADYLRNYHIIGMGVLGTTITLGGSFCQQRFV